jgi:hypothetical protein
LFFLRRLSFAIINEYSHRMLSIKMKALTFISHKEETFRYRTAAAGIPLPSSVPALSETETIRPGSEVL